MACGLDSAQTGEQEIAAQLRGAWEDSRAAHTCGPVLDRLIGEALGMARRVRRLSAGVRAPSLGGSGGAAGVAASRWCGGRARGAPRRLGHDAPLRGDPARTRAFRCSSSIAACTAAEELAAAVGAETLSLERFRAQPPAVSALVLAAGGGEALLDAAELVRLRSAAPDAPLLIDFGVPPNVDPASARSAALTRIGMDELIESAQSQRLAQLLRLAPVRAAIDDRLAHLRTELALRAIGPRLAQLRGAFERIAAEEVARALAHGLRTLDERQRAQLERLAGTLAHRLAHLPLTGLKAAAVHAGAEPVDAFFEAVQAMRRSRTDAGKS